MASTSEGALARSRLTSGLASHPVRTANSIRLMVSRPSARASCRARRVTRRSDSSVAM